MAGPSDRRVRSGRPPVRAGADVYPLFSPKSGLLAGQEVPIIAGVKLTGTAPRRANGLENRARSAYAPSAYNLNTFLSGLW